MPQSRGSPVFFKYGQTNDGHKTSINHVPDYEKAINMRGRFKEGIFRRLINLGPELELL